MRTTVENESDAGCGKRCRGLPAAPTHAVITVPFSVTRGPKALVLKYCHLSVGGKMASVCAQALDLPLSTSWSLENSFNFLNLQALC